MSLPTHTDEGLTLGPVQMLIVGFQGDNFDGSIMKELDRLKEHDIVRLIDLLFVKKNDDGEIEVVQRSDLGADEAEQFGAIVGALVGFGAEGEEGVESGALAGRPSSRTAMSSTTTPSGTWAMRSPRERRLRSRCSSTAGRSRCATRSRRPEGSRSPTRGSTSPTSSRSEQSRGRRRKPELQPAAWGVMPHAAACSSPGSSTTRPSPLAKAFGAQVIGSTAMLLRRSASGRASPVKTIRYG